MIMVLAAMIWNLNNILNAAIWCTPAVLFIVFLILFIVNLIKAKKEKIKKYKVKSIVFGCLSAYFLETVIAEIAFIAMMASAVAHM